MANSFKLTVAILTPGYQQILILYEGGFVLILREILGKFPRGGGVLDYGSDGGVWQISPHPVPCRIKKWP